MTDKFVAIEIVDAIASVTLARPERANSMGSEMLTGLRDALAECIGRPDIRALVISGEGRHFCAGGDLDHPLFSTEDDDERRAHIEVAYAITDLLLDAPMPVICAVHGRCAGAGLAIVLASDIRIASESAMFSLDFVRLGLAPDMGVTWLLGQSIGAGRALDFALSGDLVTSERAEQWGVVTRVVPDGTDVDAAMQLASTMAQFPPAGLRAARRLVRNGPGLDRGAAFEAEIETMLPLTVSDATQERLEAFRSRAR